MRFPCLLLPAVLLGSSSVSASSDLCPSGSSLSLSTSPAGSKVMSNGYVCAVLDPSKGSLAELYADFKGEGSYGKNVLAGEGITLDIVSSGGRNSGSRESVSSSSSNLGSFSVKTETAVAIETTFTVTASSDDDASSAVETWTLALSPGDRYLSFSASGLYKSSSSDEKSLGKLSSTSSPVAVRRTMSFSPFSIYGLYDSGPIQMKDADDKTHFSSYEKLSRLYSLGYSNGDVDGNTVGQAFNAAIDISFPPEESASQTVLTAKRNEGTQLQQVLLGIYPVLESWTPSAWSGADPLSAPSGSWSSGSTSTPIKLSPNNLDFPALSVAKGEGLARQEDVHAFLTGIYGSPTGCLQTHTGLITRGVSLGQIATTIARPDFGYGGTYNYFDPDNYISTSAMMMSGDPYLQENVKKVLLRSGDFLLSPSGQLPHHFEGASPTYLALSGEVQTGPNIFWILSVLRYAGETGDLSFLSSYMPTLRLASTFLNDLYDDACGLAIAPGSLMIDVFLRKNVTSDTNGMLPGFLREFADAEEAVGNLSAAEELRKRADRGAMAMDALLWVDDATLGGHYVTQVDGCGGGNAKDFVDYDSNLIALAHGVPADPKRAAEVFRRVDGGRCRKSATFVSEKYYGPDDTTGGNTGDSWCAMGRIAWFDGLARKRYGDYAGFENFILNPLVDQVIESTWMHERLDCDGLQQHNRTDQYFEYPSVTAMLIREIKYGIKLGISSVTVDPFYDPGQDVSFRWHFGDVNIGFSKSSVDVVVPRGLSADDTRATKFTFGRLAINAVYDISNSDNCGGGGSGGNATTDEYGMLTFEAVAGMNCVVKATRRTQ